jgi:hypothetical protein
MQSTGECFVEEFVRSSDVKIVLRKFWNISGCAGIEKLVERLDGRLPTVKWDFEGIHYFDNGPLTAQYLLVLDALNFCFWPGLYSLSRSISLFC